MFNMKVNLDENHIPLNYTSLLITDKQFRIYSLLRFKNSIPGQGTQENYIRLEYNENGWTPSR